MPPRFIARQLSHPKGFLGVLVSRLMNRTNLRMNTFAVRQLDLMPPDRVLEIGFGGGVTLPSLLAGARFVAGIDRSTEMVHRANRTFAEAVVAGNAVFREGSVESIPFGAATFGKACTVNTVYFWKSLHAGFEEIHRVLAPGGRLVVGFLPKEWMDRMGMPKDIFTSRTADDVIAALRSAGFVAIRVERPEPSTAWNVIVAFRAV